MYGEPYKQVLWDWPGIYERAKDAAKQPSGSVKGLGASAGVFEGIARVVDSADQFDQVKKGEVLVCKMTSPSWVVLFTKIGALVTDSGGALSHPAVVSREFGIPAVVGTRTATQMIKTGQRVQAERRIWARGDPWLTQSSLSTTRLPIDGRSPGEKARASAAWRRQVFPCLRICDHRGCVS